jgi:hypothetical protein
VRKAKTKANQPEEGGRGRRAVETADVGSAGQFATYQERALRRVAESRLLASSADVLALGRRYGNQAVQRLLTQRRPNGKGFDLDRETARRINRARAGGQPLASRLQEEMTPRLGYDFSGVRIHTGPQSDLLNRRLGARAFTTGRDIFFRGGEYDPGSARGRELIAHELTHVVQQGAGRVPASGGAMTVRPDSDAFEREARLAARYAARRGEDAAAISFPPLEGRNTVTPAIQRAPAGHIEPDKLKSEHPAIIAQDADYTAANRKIDGKVRIKVPLGGPLPTLREILCTQAVALAKREGTALAAIGDLLALQGAVEAAARNDTVGSVLAPGGYKQPGKIVHWITGAAGNRTHKHSAVVTSGGKAAGYNQTTYVDGGKAAGLYNVGKIKWPDNVTVKLTD